MKRWVFTYKQNPKPATTGTVEARDEKYAVLVAAKWCLLNNARFIAGSVKPDILADESILLVSDGPEKEPEPQEAI